MEKQTAVASIDGVEPALGHARVAQRRDPQMKGTRGSHGNTQLRCAQQCQGVAADFAAAMGHQYLVIPDLLHPTGRHNYSLDQQLQRRTFRTSQVPDQTLQNLLVNIIHSLFVNSAHRSTT